MQSPASVISYFGFCFQSLLKNVFYSENIKIFFIFSCKGFNIFFFTFKFCNVFLGEFFDKFSLCQKNSSILPHSRMIVQLGIKVQANNCLSPSSVQMLFLAFGIEKFIVNIITFSLVAFEILHFGFSDLLFSLFKALSVLSETQDL